MIVGLQIVEATWIRRERRASVHPEIQKVASNNQGRAIARNRFAPGERIEIGYCRQDEENRAQNRQGLNRLAPLCGRAIRNVAEHAPSRGIARTGVSVEQYERSPFPYCYSYILVRRLVSAAAWSSIALEALTCAAHLGSAQSTN